MSGWRPTLPRPPPEINTDLGHYRWLGCFVGPRVSVSNPRPARPVSLKCKRWVHRTDTLVPLVANQIVSLLLSTDSHDAHNERNLVRLVMILNAIPNLKENYHDRWATARFGLRDSQ